jgi:hypothetical protein
MRARVLLAGLIAVVASLVLAASAYAGGKTAVVTTNTDDGSLTGCTLRDAIQAVSLDTPFNGCGITSPGGDDHVNFAPSMSGQTITLNGTQIVINDADDLSITGPGMNQLTVSGNDASRVFNVQSATSITGLSIVHGKAPAGTTAQGGAINSTATGPFSLVLTDVKVADSAAEASASSGQAFADGGAIHAADSLRMSQSVVTGSHATATQSGTASGDSAEARGGAIFAEGFFSLVDSTVSGNQATSTSDGANGQSAATAGIRYDDELDMQNSTISGNVASATSTGMGTAANATGALLANGAAGGSVEQSTIAANKADATPAPVVGTKRRAGGVLAEQDLFITSSTIALNGPDTDTGIDGQNLLVTAGTTDLLNTILADPRGGGDNCLGLGGTLTSSGFNDDYSPAGSSCFAISGTDLDANPLLNAGGLADNGGLTQTIALQPASPVIDQGANTGLTNPNQDQRGAAFLRPVVFPGIVPADNGTDIGAFEVQQACPPFVQSTPTTPCPPSGGGGGGGGGGSTPPTSTAPEPTGLRAAALMRCKKKHGVKRKKCVKRAKQLPV